MNQWTKVYLLGIFYLTLLSCGREEILTYNIGEYYNCYEEESWSVLKIREQIEGTWEWNNIDCYFSSDELNSSAFSDITIEFKDDSRLIVKNGDRVIEETSWQVFKVLGRYYALETEPSISYVAGLILICDDQLVFSDSDLGGCDQFYTKK